LTVVIDIKSMRDDLRAFGRAAKLFIRNKQRLAELEQQLSSAVSEAARGNGELNWSTDFGEGAPIVTELSKSYRNHGKGRKELSAEVSFNFKGALDPGDHNRFVVQKGGTRVKLKWNDAGGESLCHFDVHPHGEGHPMLHIQFESVINELPRFHSVLAHPLDILEFILMELFQEKWRQSWSELKFTSEIRKYPVNQRKRIASVLKFYSTLIDPTKPALVGMLDTPSVPLELYPT
jgi:hypothetical protein